MSTNPAMQRLVDFLCGSTSSDEIIDMDCNMCCEQLACLAEQVAAGARLADLRPDLEAHFHTWPDSAEEFYALVAILRAEASGTLQE
ncbi:MAG: hypothetical protein HXY40_14330 [Chloroflexi bacterium]|nr:hypothetical protein [Chloroflexota bacterium]